MSSKFSNAFLFWQEALSRPRQIGAVAPSSRGLSKAMARWLPEDRQARILELGPGTGVVTQALIDRGMDPSQLIAIEKSNRLSAHLRDRFPGAAIIHGDALNIGRLVRESGGREGEAAAIFSSLPLLNFEPAFAEKVLEQSEKLLRPGGRLIMFTYGIGAKIQPRLGGLEFVDSKIVWINLPPARVLVYRRPDANKAGNA